MRISVIIPCLNEERTVVSCIKKAQEGITTSGYDGEIIVVDNGSSDATKQLALDNGARVVEVRAPGHGNAIRGGLDFAQGDYVVIGDGDDSYDFSVIPAFIEKLEREDLDLVIGNRFSGSIEKNAMPFLNRYLGNPGLSFIGRVLYNDPCGDFHSGLRAGKRLSLLSLKLRKENMEFATEMIIKAATQQMRIGEIPITLYKDGRGRPPHLKRWRDGFTNLVFMFKYRFFGEK